MTQARVHSRGLRIWHWLDAIVVIALISTFFLRESLVSNSRYLIQRLKDSGLQIDDTTSRPIIHNMVDQLWTWHIYIGYVLTALFLWRVVLFFTDKTHPFKECWQLICQAREKFDFRNIHNAAVKTGYIVFYALQFFMILTGLTLAFGEKIGLTESVEDLIQEGHEAVMWFFLAFAIAHIAGVFFAENTDEPGIVSAMINGHQDPKDK